MPQTAMLVDQMRLQHGAEQFNQILRKAISGQPGLFWARENGHEVGTRDTTTTSVIMWDERGIPYRADPDWMVDALQLAADLGIAIVRDDPDDPDENRQIAERLRTIIAADQQRRTELIEATNG